MSGLTVSHRLLQAVLGAAIGIAVNALVLPPVHLRDVRENLGGLARGARDALARMAEGLVHEDWSEETAADWRRLSDRLQQRLESLRSARLWSHESLRLNPGLPRRSRGKPLPLPAESEDQRWGAIVAQIGGVTTTMTDIADERARRLHRHHRRSRHPADPGSEHLASPRAGHLAAARTHERGGTVGVGPLPFGPGHQAILRDPDGGLSTVTTV
ncbi:aromatic acid exporter family protein [Streptomyces malaysiensis]|uniref:hypothetical protein n=1 Tax=Streptomyces malaysiensis TaxID=92644 RepID=UPI0033C5A037